MAVKELPIVLYTGELHSSQPVLSNNGRLHQEFTNGKQKGLGRVGGKVGGQTSGEKRPPPKI